MIWFLSELERTIYLVIPGNYLYKFQVCKMSFQIDTSIKLQSIDKSCLNFSFFLDIQIWSNVFIYDNYLSQFLNISYT